MPPTNTNEEWENQLREMINGIADYNHDTGDRAVLLVKSLISQQRKEAFEEGYDKGYETACGERHYE